MRISLAASSIFYMASALSRIFQISRSMAVLNCAVAVIIVIVYWFYAAKILIIIETQLKTK